MSNASKHMIFPFPFRLRFVVFFWSFMEHWSVSRSTLVLLRIWFWELVSRSPRRGFFCRAFIYVVNLLEDKQGWDWVNKTIKISHLILKYWHLHINRSLETSLLVVGDSGVEKIYFISFLFYSSLLVLWFNSPFPFMLLLHFQYFFLV